MQSEIVRTYTGRTPRNRDDRRPKPEGLAPSSDGRASLGFGKYFADHVFRMQYRNGRWDRGRIEPYRAIAMDPGAASLHYAQSIFEGFKATAETRSGSIRAY